MSKLTINDIPQDWKDILAEVQTAFPDAVIAGGCLRDLEYGKEVKDVDIFALAADMFDDAVMSMFPDATTDSPNWLQYGGGTRNESGNRIIEAVYNLNQGDFKYELILGIDETADIETFDFSICQIKFDGTRIVSTPSYDKTLETGDITLDNPKPVHRTTDRIARIMNKFPDMAIIGTVDV